MTALFQLAAEHRALSDKLHDLDLDDQTPDPALLRQGLEIQATQANKKAEPMARLFYLAGDEGFEPPITGPEPVALPLGQSPIC